MRDWIVLIGITVAALGTVLGFAILAYLIGQQSMCIEKV